MTVQEALTEGQAYLKERNIESPERNAQELLAFSMNLSRASIISEPSKLLKAEIFRKYTSSLQKRGKRVPLQYIIGIEYFDDLVLKVGPGVLIPRPETELLTQAVKKRFENKSTKLLIVDLGTGSGNIALSLAKYYSQAKIFGVDKSEKALKWARKNRSFNKIKNVQFLKGNAESIIPKKYWRTFDIVVSNPPYIRKADMNHLQKELSYEPLSAFVGGENGLRDIRHMIRAASFLLGQAGVFLCEIGINQKKDVCNLFKQYGFEDIEIIDDWQDIPRIVIGKLLVPTRTNGRKASDETIEC